MNYATFIKEPTVNIDVSEERIINNFADFGDEGKQVLRKIEKGLNNPNRHPDDVVTHFAFNPVAGEIYLILTNNKPLPFSFKWAKRGKGFKVERLIVIYARSSLALLKFLEACIQNEKPYQGFFIELSNLTRAKMIISKIPIK